MPNILCFGLRVGDLQLSYFQEAKAHFIASHQHPINQMLHHFNIVLIFISLFWLFRDWRVTAVCIVLTQVCAWSGHFIFEKNKPAFVKYPAITVLVSLVWSFENWLGLKQLLGYLTNKQPVNTTKTPLQP
jgi:hypothetical protein